jgi:hypothetical protein
VRRFCARLVAVLLLLLLGSGQAAAQDRDVLSRITDDRIAESSALVQSTADRELAYTINDSGNEAAVYVIELATGDVVGTTTLDVATEDTEAMAIGADDRLYVADIGDNDSERKRVALYALDQPTTGVATVSPEVYDVRYEDGPSDAETLLVDPVTGRMSIVTKNLLAGTVYRLPMPLRADRINVARPVPDVAVTGLATDGAYLPDGSGILLRTYIDIAVYAAPSWREIGTIDTPPQRQSESLAAWKHRGHTVLVGTEKLPSTIVEVKIPRREWRQLHDGPDRHGSDRPPSLAADESDSTVSDNDVGRGWVLWSGVMLLLLGGAWLWTRRSRSARGG